VPRKGAQEKNLQKINFFKLLCRSNSSFLVHVKTDQTDKVLIAFNEDHSAETYEGANALGELVDDILNGMEPKQIVSIAQTNTS
jgi:hypothetical protein